MKRGWKQYFLPESVEVEILGKKYTVEIDEYKESYSRIEKIKELRFTFDKKAYYYRFTSRSGQGWYHLYERRTDTVPIIVPETGKDGYLYMLAGGASTKVKEFLEKKNQTKLK